LCHRTPYRLARLSIPSARRSHSRQTTLVQCTKGSDNVIFRGTRPGRLEQGSQPLNRHTLRRSVEETQELILQHPIHFYFHPTLTIRLPTFPLSPHFEDHFVEIGTDFIIVAMLQELLDLIPKPAPLSVMSGLGDGNKNRFNMIEHLASRWVGCLILHSQRAVGIYRSDAKPRKLGPAVRQLVAGMLFQSIKQPVAIVGAGLPDVDESETTVIESIDTLLIAKIDNTPG
jgi:hypothetical protein